MSRFSSSNFDKAVKPPVEGRQGAELSSPIQIRIISLDKVELSQSQIVVYRDEGFYVVAVVPSMIVEVEGPFGKRYFGVGKLLGYSENAAEAIELMKNVDPSDVDGFDLLYLPKRLLREFAQIAKKDLGKTYVGIIHAAGKGRDRTYTRLQKPSVATFTIEPSSDELDAALQRLQKFIQAGNGKKNGGENA